jgi:hypothetical protein
MVGSLTGAVTSQRVTEVHKGKLKLAKISIVECNGKSLLDCKIDISNRDESRS